MKSFFAALECVACGRRFDGGRLQSLCPDCRRPLRALYDLPGDFSPAGFAARPFGLWRYRELLPPIPESEVATLGEGGTPLHPARRLGARLRVARLLLKDEGLNPTGSFKARGMSVAVSAAKALGAKELFAPSAGNAGMALAAYGARAGLPVTLAFPAGTPEETLARCRALGAETSEVPGSIAEAGQRLRERMAGRAAAFDLSTFREPYRVEGKKTMGYELFEQLGGQLPDAILYPLGGGTGLVALAKAFDEMEALGWIDKRRPRLYAVQAEGCAPIVRAFERGAETAEPVADPRTRAYGLRVPATIADAWILRCLRESHGGAVAVSEEEIESGVRDLAREEGLLVAPEAGAAFAGLRRLVQAEKIRTEESVVVFLTANAAVY